MIPASERCSAVAVIALASAVELQLWLLQLNLLLGLVGQHLPICSDINDCTAQP